VNAYNPARARDLGAELKAARERAGLRQTEVAARIRRSQSQVSRWEKGQGVPDEAALGAMLLLYEVADDEHDYFLRLVREATNPDWVQPGVSRRLAATIESERTARLIVNVEPMIIPGLCQTEAYARALMTSMGRDEIDQRVALRMTRQALLSEPNAPEYVAIIGEHALRYPPCDSDIMRGQLYKLRDLGNLPGVSIVVQPFENQYTPTAFGPFAIFTPRHSGGPVVRREGLAATTTITNTRDVQTYQTAVDLIRRQAMSAPETSAYIAALLNEME